MLMDVAKASIVQLMKKTNTEQESTLRQGRNRLGARVAASLGLVTCGLQLQACVAHRPVDVTKNQPARRTQDSWTLEIPSPNALAGPVRTHGDGENGMLEFTICVKEPPGADSWLAALGSHGYTAQAGMWDVPGVVYGVRFRRDGVYGDLAVWRSAAGDACQVAIMRTFRGSGVPHFPDRYAFYPSPICGLLRGTEREQVGCLPFFTGDTEWSDVERLYEGPIE